MAKKYCTKCGAELPDNVKFCPTCGAPVLPEDDNKLDQTEPAGYQNTASVPDFHSDNTEDTQNLNNSSWTQQDNYYNTQESSPYNNPDYADNYEKPKKHVGLIILIIVIAICVAGFFFLLFAKPEFLTDTLHLPLPFGNRETAAEQASSSEEETAKPEKKEMSDSDTDTAEPESTSLPEDTSKPKTTATPKPTSGVLKTTDDNTKTVTPAAPSKQGTGTVYISANANPRRIRVRTAPSQSATDTGGRKYNGDVVTVYETRQAEGYTWYRIGDNQWIAGNGSSFGVSMN